ncbi:MAG: hypothetical protein JO272_16345 [Pseudonocardiales bacterium]|nr:hypothetical protein [Pseudonocardiales bacterium]
MWDAARTLTARPQLPARDQLLPGLRAEFSAQNRSRELDETDVSGAAQRR